MNSWGRRLRLAVILCASALAVVARPTNATAQAWAPPPGVWVVSSTYQFLTAPDHTDSQGNLILTGGRTGRVRSHSILLGADTALTDKLALSISLPYVTSVYQGGRPHRGLHSGGVDDGHWHGGFQDFQFGLRYQVRARPVAVAPFIAGVVPSHDYPPIAHNAIGKGLRGVTVGAAAGGLFESALAYYQVQYAYAAKEQVEGFRPNTSRLTAEFGYVATDRLTLRVFETLEVVHNGLDFPEDYVGLPPERSQVHDQITKERVMTIGAGVTFVAARAWDLHASIATSVWSENSHTLRSVAVGVNRYFQFGRAPANPSLRRARTDTIARTVGPLTR